MRHLRRVGGIVAVIVCWQGGPGAYAATAPQADLAAAEQAWKSSRDPQAAISAADSILVANRGDAEVAGGALILRARAEKRGLKKPAAALATLDTLLANYPQVRTSEVMLLQLDCADEIPDKARFEKTHADIEKRFPDQPAVLATAEDKHAYFLCETVRDERGAVLRWRNLLAKWPETPAAAEALVQLADTAPLGDFAGSIRSYSEALKHPAGLRKDLADYARQQTAVASYQLGDEKAALKALAELDARPDLSAKRRAEVRFWIGGLSDAESSARQSLLFDRAIRWRHVKTHQDSGFVNLQRVACWVVSPAGKAWLADKNTTPAERAAMRYRACMAMLEAGRGQEPFALAQSILDEDKPEGHVRWQCLYAQAHLIGRGGDHEGSAARWRALLAEPGLPDGDVRAAAMMMLSQELDLSGDAAGALENYLDVEARMPWRGEADNAARAAELVVTGNPELKPTLQPSREAAMARWGRGSSAVSRAMASPPGARSPLVPPVASVVAGTPDLSKPAILSAAPEAPPKGGAE